MLISKTTKDNWFTNDHFLAPVMGYVAISTYMLVINETNINGYIVNVFHTAIFYSIFRLKTEKMEALMTFLCKTMGWILLFSTPAFLLYLVGFPFVGVDAVYGEDLYSFTNYFLFMIDDRSLWAFFPRFSSVFLEPGHLGTAAALLLSTQFGKWKKWYNIVLLVALLLTFSLAAYVIYVVVIFLKLWVQGKQFIGKLVMVVTFIAAIVTGSFFYNNGENLLHDLILIRLEVEDGELAGNNRVTEDFDTDFEKLCESSAIIFGKKRENPEFGNSGYKVFMYENGIIGTVLMLIFYIASLGKIRNRRATASAFFLALLGFIVRGYPLWYSNYLPYYGLSHDDPAIPDDDKKEKDKKQKKSE
uniref:hypothetical protein n=1 Tax=Prevotella sp. TaxID=59823 RepID=UPI003FEEF9E5